MAWAALVAGVILATWGRCSAEVQKEVIEHIKCAVCEKTMEMAVTSAEESKEKDEDALADLVDGLCTLKKSQGKWTATHDIFRRGSEGALELRAMPGLGSCRSECASIQRACTVVLKNKEDTIVSMLLKQKDAEMLKGKVCKKVCAKKLPKLTDWKDEPYVERDAKEVEAEERVEKMQAETGQKFKMYSRDEIAGMSQSDIELEAAKDALGAQRREAKYRAEADAEQKGIRPSAEL